LRSPHGQKFRQHFVLALNLGLNPSVNCDAVTKFIYLFATEYGDSEFVLKELPERIRDGLEYEQAKDVFFVGYMGTIGNRVRSGREEEEEEEKGEDVEAKDGVDGFVKDFEMFRDKLSAFTIELDFLPGLGEFFSFPTA
jgi:hypothetical protein